MSNDQRKRLPAHASVNQGVAIFSGRYTDMIWNGVPRPNSHGGFIEPNKTVVK
jgi:hypothetical protein